MRALLATCLCLVAAPAMAAPHKVFVLRSNSTTDWGTRTHIEKTVLGLARNVDRGVSRGETTFDDIALSIGCTKGLDGCKNELLDSLMIDELVVITITPSGADDVKVTVKRASKAGIRTATATANKADPDAALLAGIGPLFGAKKVIGEKPQPAQKPGKGTMTTGAVEVSNEPAPKSAPSKPEAQTIDNEDPLTAKHAKPPPPAEIKPVETAKPADAKKPVEPPVAAKPPEPARASATASTVVTPEPPRAEPPPPPPAPPPPAVAPAPPPAQDSRPNPTPASPDSSDGDERGRKPLYIGGMVAGGVTALVGVALWSKASSAESEAKAAPNRSAADIAALKDLESSGDHYALAGNVMFVGGLVLGGVSGYLYWRSGHHTTTQVAPLALAHGGGIAISFEVP